MFLQHTEVFPYGLACWCLGDEKVWHNLFFYLTTVVWLIIKTRVCISFNHGLFSICSSESIFFPLPSAAFLFLRKQLCPALIVILGNPIHDKTITSAHSSICLEADSPSSGISDHGRGSGCSSTAPALSGPVARTIYYIAAELVRLVGSVESMKPVLQSLYHRILLYPPPQHRVEAIKIMKEVG